MPLHDWANQPGWDGVRLLWTVELLRVIKPQLPPPYRVMIGTSPTFLVGAPVEGRPDVGVRDWPLGEQDFPEVVDPDSEPDEVVALATIPVKTSLLIERDGRLVSAVELVSPRDKDRSPPAPRPAVRLSGICWVASTCYLSTSTRRLLFRSPTRSPARSRCPNRQPPPRSR